MLFFADDGLVNFSWKVRDVIHLHDIDIGRTLKHRTNAQIIRSSPQSYAQNSAQIFGKIFAKFAFKVALIMQWFLNGFFRFGQIDL